MKIQLVQCISEILRTEQVREPERRQVLGVNCIGAKISKLWIPLHKL